ncbi:hypothetical protein EVJ58_g1199 [Rhodofomes roseus]|uniref:L-tryptophan decarboxylase PsiD-like domain-containing protein n=1 Tax=Rhodofomes roseus TaxID=34475 RepID=A0A4Y9Z254_9APHY|nr:hypothetical protein EVJ58_g1199 [Rhodofomes roseus]
MDKHTKIHARHDDVPKEHRVHRTGDWLPGDHRIHKEWLSGVIEHVDKNPKDLHPVLQEFKTLIETDTRVYMLMQSMFEQVPTKPPYSSDPTGHRQIRDYEHMLQLFNHLITTPPQWSDRSHRVGMVGVPINAVLDWPMGTPSGFALFLDPGVNRMLKKVLDAWGEYLRSGESAKQALNDGPNGWFSADGTADLTTVANGAVGTSHTFEDIFECDPSRPYHGFASWDAFFTRKFRENVRPVAAPNDDNVIANACESKAYNVARNVALRDAFWIKGQPYSVLDMLAYDERAPLFAGGTVYQAGRVVRAYVKEGTYYSEPLFEGVGDPAKRDTDGDAINMQNENASQVYLTAVATRAIIFIKADNPAIGLMAFLGVGMTEVSTCEITVREGDHVKKGDEIGMFHFGGSTHCLMFRKGVDVQGFPDPGGAENVPVRGKLAVVKSGV